MPLPPYDTIATADRLTLAFDRHQPVSVICLGDSFHDQAAPDRITPVLLDRIRSLTARFEWIWITGNHDPAPDPVWGGRAVAEITKGPLVFRHQAVSITGHGEVSGHYHPKARVGLRGSTISGACFVTDGRRLVMPAFGAFTGGLDVGSREIKTLFPRRFEILFRGPNRISRFPDSALIPSRHSFA